MTAVMSAAPRRGGPRYLRWALVREGRIEREEVIGPDRALTVGPTGDVHDPRRDADAPLLVTKDGGWVLHVIDGLEGRTKDGTIRELAERARRDDGGRPAIDLTPDARVRLVIGDVALLLQLVDPPPVKNKPRLPASLSGGMLAGTDWWFTSFVACSFILHFALVTYLSQADYEIERALIPSEYVAEIMFDPEPIPDDSDIPEEVMDPDGEAEDTGPELAENDTPAPPRPAPTPRPTSTEGNANRTQESLDAEAIADADLAVQEVLGAISGTMGNVVNRLTDGADLGESAELLAGVSGTTVGQEEAPGRIAMRQGTQRVACDGEDGESCIGHLARRRSVGAQEGAEVVEVEVRRPRAAPEGPGGLVPDPPVGWNSQELYRALRMRMRAIQGCYEHQLTHGDPGLGGRLTIEMEVMPVGTLSGVRVSTNTTGSDALAQCAVRAVRTVRVRTGPPERVHAEFPVVFSNNQ